MIIEFLLVGIGGFIGSCLRFALTKAMNHLHLLLPIGTMLSNVIAGIAIGVILGFEQQSVLLNPKCRLFLATGLLGGLSTFSTFSAETIQMFNGGKYLVAAGNILLNLGLSLLGVMLGIFLVNKMHKV